MSAYEHSAEYVEVEEIRARDELERLLADPRFHATDRAKKILKYVAEHSLEGETCGVKAYAIAIDVLKRTERFDSGSDPIVRIEISRLRNALSNYYEAYGDELDIKVHLPVGRYVVLFVQARFTGEDDLQRNQQDATRIDMAEGGEAVATSNPPGRQGTRRWRHYAGAAAVLLLAAVGLAAAAYYVERPSLSQKPSIVLLMSSADDDHAIEADATQRYLLAALSKFRTFDIDSEIGLLSGVSNAYRVDMRYYVDSGYRTIWWQVVDPLDGGILRSGVERIETGGRSIATVRAALVSSLAKRLGGSRGVIGNIVTHDGAARVPGNACVLKAEFELDEGGAGGIRSAAPCLERTLALRPDDPDAMAALSRVLIAMKGADPLTTDFGRAVDLANRAVAVDPTSDRAYIALMMAKFYAGDSQSAIAAGNTAMDLNPDNPDVLAKLAGVLFNAGFREAGLSLAKEASANVEAVPRDARIVLSLEAYLRGDYSEASLGSEQINYSDFVVQAIRAAALGEMSSSSSAASLARLKEMLPDYRTSLRTWMERRRYSAEVIAALKAGLAKAEQIRAPDESLAQASY